MTLGYCHDVIESICRAAAADDVVAVLEDGYLRLADTDIGIKYVEASDSLRIQLAVARVPVEARRATLRAMLEFNLSATSCHFGLIDGDVALTLREVPISAFDPAGDPMRTLLDQLDDMAGHWDQVIAGCGPLNQPET